MVEPVRRPSFIPPTVAAKPMQRILPGPTISNILAYPAQTVTGRYNEEIGTNEVIEQIQVQGKKGTRFKNIVRSVEPSQRLPPLQTIKLSKRPTPPMRKGFF
jgi:hypothetical protein